LILLLSMPAGKERSTKKWVDTLFSLLGCDEKAELFLFLAKWNGLVLNIAIGLQVILGALVTGLSSAISPSKVKEYFNFSAFLKNIKNPPTDLKCYFA
jgi:SMODS and SLOG-associating 2TM effector domain